MLTFNGQNLLCIHQFAKADKPQLHAQRNHFAGVWGESQIVLGVGGRDISIKVWLTDASFTTSAAVDSYRQAFDLSVGTVADLAITGNTQAYYADVTFEGFEPTDSVKQAIGVGMPAGTFFQEGIFHFHQNSVP